MNPLDLTDITAVSFDADMTLWDFEKIMWRGLTAAHEEMRRVVGDAAAGVTIDDNIALWHVAVDECTDPAPNLVELRLEGFRRTLNHIGIVDEDLAVRLANTYSEHRFDDLELYPDTAPTLDALAPHFLLGVTSNGVMCPEDCGIHRWFDFLLFAHDFGATKPDPRIFHEACRQAECQPRQMLHVGDCLYGDVGGAAAAGMPSVWLNRKSKSRPADALTPDFEIQSLAELPPLLLRGRARVPDSSG